MLYVLAIPRFTRYHPATQAELTDTYPSPVPGAVHMRYASHPWGRSSLGAPSDEAWSNPEPILTRDRAAPYLGCDEQGQPAGCTGQHDPHRPLQIALEIDARTAISPADWGDITRSCLNGDAARQAVY